MSKKLSVNSNAKLNETQAHRRGEQVGADAPPAFHLGSRGSKNALFKCNDLLSKSKQYLIGKDDYLYDCERHSP